MQSRRRPCGPVLAVLTTGALKREKETRGGEASAGPDVLAAMVHEGAGYRDGTPSRAVSALAPASNRWL